VRYKFSIEGGGAVRINKDVGCLWSDGMFSLL